MEKAILLVALRWCLVCSREIFPEKGGNQDLQSSNSAKVSYEYVSPVIQIPDVYNSDQQVQNYGYVPPSFPLLQQPQPPKIDVHAIIGENPLLAALLLGASLGLSPKSAAPNHPELLPINPYVALLLSQYGRYVPVHGAARGIYGYAAANNFHNNKPFGAYKVHEDAKRSSYGGYVSVHGAARGINGYAAANNFHNNKPFGAYKVHEDTKRRYISFPAHQPIMNRG